MHMKPFQEGTFPEKFLTPPTYRSQIAPPSLIAKYFPSLYFYSHLLLGPFRWLCLHGYAKTCNDFVWAYGSTWFIEQVESLGCPLIIEGLDVLANLKEPCVFVANHMSTLETFFLPGIIRPYLPVTFVVKHSLVDIPLFGPVMRSRDPIVLNRKNPREDLSVVLNEGQKRLANGISIIIFPQSTRMAKFDPQNFNTIGEKLAKKANVPVVPIALKTDAWTAGRHIKEIGPILAGMPIHFRFHEPCQVIGNGKALHGEICEFITKSLEEWSTDTPKTLS